MMSASNIELSSATPIVGVGIMVIDHENKVLLGHRIKTGEASTWCFPGGKIEAHESLAQAAARELFEESNLAIDTYELKSFLMFLNRSNPRVNMTTGFVVQLQSDEIKKDLKVTEAHIFESWQWFSFDALPKNLFPETAVMLQYWLKQKVDERFSVYAIVNE